MLFVMSDLLKAQDSTWTGNTRITYLTGSSAYLDAGSEHGIVVGTRLVVMRGDTLVAGLTAAYVSGRRSSCTIESRNLELRVGDLVRFQPVKPVDVAETRISTPVPATDSSPPELLARPRSGGLHGRVGVRYLMAQESGGSARYTQPALDLRLDGPLDLTGFTVGVDVRARRTSSLLADGSRDQNGSYRVYNLALAWRPGRSPFRLTAGRQFSAPLASVNFFDGIMAEYSKPRWGTGLFAGTQPDPADFGYSGTTREAGGYLQFHSGPSSDSRWSLTGGVVGSYQSGEVNREFGFLQAALYARYYSLYVSQEVDYNRGWKVNAGENVVSPTSTYANLSIRPSNVLTFRAGFDNRRNVRLYRDFINPLTQFDDAFRQGMWGGLALNPGSGYHLGFDLRNSTGGSGGTARVYTLSLSSDRLVGSSLSLGARSTRYLTDTNQGWLHSITLGISPSNAAHLELTGGLRSNFDPQDNPENTQLNWLSLDFDLSVGRAWYLLLSASHETGSAEAMNQVFGGLSLRF